jgi:hypothetical protein
MGIIRRRKKPADETYDERVVRNAKVRQESAIPTQKVVAGTVAGALSTIIIAVLNERFHIQLSETESAGLVTLLIVVTQYLIPPAPRDGVKAK